MMKKLICTILALCMLLILSAASFAEGGQAKEVYIDNTVDGSRSYVIGSVVISTEKSDGTVSKETKTVYTNSANVTFSNPRPEVIQNYINSAYNTAYTVAQQYGSNVQMSTSDRSETWDNRKYTTQESGSGVLVGDESAVSGEYGVTESYTVTHIASGDYGRNTYYTVTASVTVKEAAEEPAEEEPAEEEPAEEEPAEEEPAEEKPAEEKPAEEEPAEEKPAEEKPAEEKPAEEKPAEEKPAEEKPAEEKPAEEKPAEEKPAEEKPAEEKPAEEKPAEDDAADCSKNGHSWITNRKTLVRIYASCGICGTPMQFWNRKDANVVHGLVKTPDGQELGYISGVESREDGQVLAIRLENADQTPEDGFILSIDAENLKECLNYQVNTMEITVGSAKLAVDLPSVAGLVPAEKEAASWTFTVSSENGQTAVKAEALCGDENVSLETEQACTLTSAE